MSQGVASTEPVSTVKVRSPADVTSLYSVPYWTLPSQELPSPPVTFSLNNREFLFLQSLKYKIKLYSFERLRNINNSTAGSRP